MTAATTTCASWVPLRRSTSTSSSSARTTGYAGAKPGETAGLIAEGVRSAMAEGARCRQVEIVLDEIAAVNHVMARSNPGDLVVMCVDKHAQVVAELENRTHSAQAGSHSSELVGDPDLDPAELARDAEAHGQEAEVQALAAEHEAVEEAEPARG